ncbi:MarR family winged helix-turn-helix transcriptional regulator [Mangrovicella endophytica]|uniref:MarR family winged helix-turn-helix transcriptional regulator n=1 Tax=Mangrovicella endophytica TaxID=2066697 RepID=UPI000C9DBD7A|nr:MarR family transcriptional regulator [Mangrovicella endophytica]
MTHQLLSDTSVNFLLNDVARLLRQAFERAVIEAGMELTPGEVRALAYATRYSGSRQAALADRMGVEPMTLSAYLDRLETQGLIQRTVDPRDRRAKIIVPTDAANQVFQDIHPLIETMYERMMNGIDADERALIKRALEHMRANLANERSGDGSADAEPVTA